MTFKANILRALLSGFATMALLTAGASTLSHADSLRNLDEYGVSDSAQAGHEESYTNALVNRLHWGHFPVRVAFVNAISANRQTLDEIAENGFNQWVRATQDEVKFDVVSNPARADITVTYETIPGRPINGGKLGTTGFHYNPTRRQLLHADMHLNVWEGMTRRDLARFENTAAHEFGHALGIDGHSPNPDDLMYFSSSSAEGVNTRDINTLRQVYGGFIRATAQNNKKNTKTRS